MPVNRAENRCSAFQWKDIRCVFTDENISFHLILFGVSNLQNSLPFLNRQVEKCVQIVLVKCYSLFSLVDERCTSVTLLSTTNLFNLKVNFCSFFQLTPAYNRLNNFTPTLFSKKLSRSCCFHSLAIRALHLHLLHFWKNYEDKSVIWSIDEKKTHPLDDTFKLLHSFKRDLFPRK